MGRFFKGMLHTFQLLPDRIEPVFETLHQLAHLTIERMIIMLPVLLRALVSFLFEMLCHVMPASGMHMLDGAVNLVFSLRFCSFSMCIQFGGKFRI